MTPLAKPAKAKAKKRKTKPAAVETPAPSGSAGPVLEATALELVVAGQENTPLGRIAMTLAKRLDHSGLDTGSAVASLARELRATIEAATSKVTPAADPVDELRARREKRQRSAG